ncbi:MAG: hypothetical protein JW909_09100 [Planctomycetes bacterium]|nr:hypothetical protein [Planctomycetota bacterium]
MLRIRKVVLAVAATGAIMAAGGCGTGVTHRTYLYVEEGQALPLEVHVDVPPGQPASGTLYYRTMGEVDYQAMQMSAAGNFVSAQLPASLSVAGKTIEYFINVNKAGTVVPLRTLANPYRVQVLTRSQLIAKTIRLDIKKTYAGEPLTITYHAGKFPIQSVEFKYLAPWMPGEITLQLQPTQHGYWMAVIPGQFVREGNWQYRAEGVVENLPMITPASGRGTFVIEKRPPEPAETSSPVAPVTTPPSM